MPFNAAKNRTMPSRTAICFIRSFLFILPQLPCYKFNDRAVLISICGVYEVGSGQDKSADGEKYNQNINWIRKSIPYSNVLKNVSESNCILEILQNNQAGPSLRFFEAVFYNKKLLTNNCHIVDFPYYNPQYMKFFKGTDDIDIEWLLDNSINVEYNYKGDFSPLHMLH